MRECWAIFEARLWASTAPVAVAAGLGAICMMPQRLPHLPAWTIAGIAGTAALWAGSAWWLASVVAILTRRRRGG